MSILKEKNWNYKQENRFECYDIYDEMKELTWQGAGTRIDPGQLKY